VVALVFCFELRKETDMLFYTIEKRTLQENKEQILYENLEICDIQLKGAECGFISSEPKSKLFC
jgi:hypothetical protein